MIMKAWYRSSRIHRLIVIGEFIVILVSNVSSIIHGNLFSFPNLFLGRRHHHTSTAHLTEAEKELCQYIQHILCTRLELVLNHTRAIEFSKTYQRNVDLIDGEFTTTKSKATTITSFHGRLDGPTPSSRPLETIPGSKEKGNRNPTDTRSDASMGAIVNIPSTGSTTHHLRTIRSYLWRPWTTFKNTRYSSSSIFPSDITSLQLDFPFHLQPSMSRRTHRQDTSHSSSSSSSSSEPTLFHLCTRAVVLAFHFTPILYTCPIAYFSSWFRNQIWYSMIAKTISNCGPAFIKWGQWASTRSDIFPDGLCTALSHLHSNAPAHTWRITQDTVEEALCIPKGSLLTIFSSFDIHPIASGSIAQVHRATLWPSVLQQQELQAAEEEEASGNNNTILPPTLVAVKVRHPRVQRLIDMDFRIMTFLARLIDAIPSLSWVQLRPSIEQFSHTMAAQAHLQIEAHHLEVLNCNFQSWDTVGFPKPFFASSSVIIETFERGSPCSAILDYYDHVATIMHRNDSWDEEQTNKHNFTNLPGSSLGYTLIPKPFAKFIVTSGVSLYLKMLLVDNLMHADLHPGNLMLDTFFYSKSHENIAPISWKRPKQVPSQSLILLGERETHQPVLRSSATMGKLPRKDGEFYGHITLVDAGMVAQLDEVESQNFVGLLVAIGEGDGRAAAEVVLGFSSITSMEAKSMDRESFTQDMVSFFATSCRGYNTNLDFSQVLRGILGLLKKHRVRIDANYATLVVNLMCVDGLARRVCPTYNCLDAAQPLLRCYKFLCQDRDGRLSLHTKRKWRQGLVRLMIPLMQARKKLSDDRFFRKLSYAATGNHVNSLK